MYFLQYVFLDPPWNHSSAKITNTRTNELHSVGHRRLTKSISFPSHITKTRISSGIGRSRVNAKVQVLYAPEAETTETLYELLGISEAVNASDIKKAYKQMARKYHPDVSPPDRVDEYTNKFIMVHEAYETLSNPQTKASYDRDLANGFSLTNRNRFYHGMNDTVGLRTSQLDDLKHVKMWKDSKGNNNMSWAARMRKSFDSMVFIRPS